MFSNRNSLFIRAGDVTAKGTKKTRSTVSPSHARDLFQPLGEPINNKTYVISTENSEWRDLIDKVELTLSTRPRSR